MALVKRISDLTAKGSDVDTTDLIPIAEVDGTSPSGYTTKYVTGAELGNSNLIEFNEVTTFTLGDYTLVLSDANKMIECNSATNVNVIIPPDSAVNFDIGTQLLISQLSTGFVTIRRNDPAVTLFAEGNKFVTKGQYALATIIKRGANTWYVSGNLTT